MSGRIRLAFVALLALSVACSDGGGRNYSEQIRENFLDACGLSSGQQDDRCECILEEIEERFTEDEFTELEQSGDFESDPDVEEAVDGCM